MPIFVVSKANAVEQYVGVHYGYAPKWDSKSSGSESIKPITMLTYDRRMTRQSFLSLGLGSNGTATVGIKVGHR